MITLANRRHKAFVLQAIQPSLLGLMDGSVSTLAPIFAAAGLTGRPLSAFFVGLAASLGAAISMGLSEALSDDGSITGRGGPLRRGAITGVATGLGGMLHTFPFLAPDLGIALSKDDPDKAVRVRTDARGRATVHIAHPGFWLIKAVHMEPAPPGTGSMWESWWASMTFETTGDTPRPR